MVNHSCSKVFRFRNQKQSKHVFELTEILHL